MSKIVELSAGSTSYLSVSGDCRLGHGVGEIENQAQAMLEVHPHFRGRKRWIQCRFSKGGLYLTGTVPSFYLKQLAQEAIRQLDGVRQVVNEIVVANAFTEPAEYKRCRIAR